jgi:hypothetical protein
MAFSEYDLHTLGGAKLKGVLKFIAHDPGDALWQTMVRRDNVFELGGRVFQPFPLNAVRQSAMMFEKVGQHRSSAFPKDSSEVELLHYVSLTLCYMNTEQHE